MVSDFNLDRIQSTSAHSNDMYHNAIRWSSSSESFVETSRSSVKLQFYAVTIRTHDNVGLYIRSQPYE
jgi:hypothetical protein